MNQPLMNYDSGVLSFRKKSSIADLGFVLHGLLAEGLHSKIYLATYSATKSTGDKVLNVGRRKLAAKVVRTDFAPYEWVNTFFNRELDILKKINHPNIIHVHSIWKVDCKFIIFMRLAEFGDLCNFILNHGSLKEIIIKRWTKQLVEALVYLHKMDIAHRDIKCENILITSKYNVKLTDFGFSRFTHDNRGHPLFASTDCGTLNYAAPEILLGLTYNPKIADIWSLGVVMYIMLNGVFPFEANDATALYREQFGKTYTFSEKAIVDSSSQLIQTIKMLLEPVYHERMSLEDLLNSPWLNGQVLKN